MNRALLPLALIGWTAVACASPSPPSARPAKFEDKRPIAGTLVFEFEGNTPLRGSLRTERGEELFLASVEVPSPRSARRIEDDKVTDLESQTGANTFSPFPERWPRKNAFSLREDGVYEVELLGNAQGVLNCTFVLAPFDRGFEGRVDGRCVDEDEQVWAARMR